MKRLLKHARTEKRTHGRRSRSARADENSGPPQGSEGDSNHSPREDGRSVVPTGEPSGALDTSSDHDSAPAGPAMEGRTGQDFKARSQTIKAPAVVPREQTASTAASATSIAHVPQVLLECYVNGALALLTPDEAHRQLHERDFGWIAPAGWVRYDWGGHAWSGPIRSRILAVGTRFGFWLLSEEGARTIDQYRKEAVGRRIAAENQLHADASRFRALFPGALRRTAPLFQWWPVLDRNGCKIPAYQVHPERSAILIAGIDPDCGRAVSGFSWTPFFSSPSASMTAGPNVVVGNVLLQAETG